MARPVKVTAKGSRFILLASMCIVVAALYFAQEVLIPVALSVLVCFLLAPLVTRLERYRLPRPAAVMVVVLAAIGLFALLAWVVASQVVSLADRLPEYQGEIVRKVERVRGRFARKEAGIGNKIGDLAHKIEEATNKPATQRSATEPSATGPSASQPTTNAATSQPGGAAPGATPAPAAPAPAPPRSPVQQLVDDPVDAAARQIAHAPAGEAPPAGTTQTNPLWVVALPAPVSPIRTLGSYLGMALSPLGTAGLVVVFVIFILLQREDLRDRMIRLVSQGDMNVTTQALDDGASRISRYLTAQAIVNGSYGLAVAAGLWLIGYFVGGKPFPSFVLWGLLCAVLRFIPYIGPWIASVFPIVLSLAVYQGFGVFVWTTGLFVVIELASNNLMEPWLYGTSTGMSTVAILVSAVFWTWLWGAVGLLLATPLTVVLVVLGKYVPQLRFLDILLGDEPVLEPPERIYQRLLAGDEEEATDLAREFLKDRTLLEVYDDVLLPALSLAEMDRHKGRLDAQRQEFIRRSMGEIVEELGDEWRMRRDRTHADVMKAAAAATVEVAKGSQAGETVDAARAGASRGAGKANGNGNGAGTGTGVGVGPGTGAAGDAATTWQDADPNLLRVPNGCTVTVVCLPAHDEADDVAGHMLAQLLEFRGYCAFALSVTKLASEMVAAVEAKGAHVVVVSALPPGAVAHSRYLCKRLHARFPELSMVVGLWTTKVDLKKAKDRVACSETVQMAAKLRQAMEQIGQLVQPVIVASEQERLRAEADAESRA
jgi:predicted PurR-regulated permease PerM